jgi:serine/threonine protein phosphatase PrpC
MVTGGILCTDGVLEELSNSDFTKVVKFESEDYVFGKFINMEKGDDDKTIIEVKISIMNTS